MNVPEMRRPRWTRGRVLAGAGAVLVLIAVLALVLTGLPGDGSNGGGSAAAATPTPAGEDVPTAPAPVTPVPTGPTSDVEQLPADLPAVPLDEPATTPDGITAEVVALEAIQGTGRGPGNVSGPALRATVRITNGSPGEVSLGGVVVDLFYGADAVPASPLDDPTSAPFSGTVAPGGTSEGVFVFTVPDDDRKMITVRIGYQAGAPFLVFTGSAG